MAASPQLPFPVPPPSEDEAAAIRVAGDYLTRAGTHAASLLLGSHGPIDAPELLAALSDNLLAGAALCAGLLDLAEQKRRL